MVDETPEWRLKNKRHRAAGRAGSPTSRHTLMCRRLYRDPRIYFFCSSQKEEKEGVELSGGHHSASTRAVVCVLCQVKGNQNASKNVGNFPLQSSPSQVSFFSFFFFKGQGEKEGNRTNWQAWIKKEEILETRWSLQMIFRTISEKNMTSTRMNVC